MFEATPDVRDAGQWMTVGRHRVTAGAAIPIILVIPGPGREQSDFFQDLDSPTVIVVPTSESLAERTRARLLSQGHFVIELENAVATDAKGHLVAAGEAKTMLGPLRERLLAVERSKRAWLLPSGTGWENLIIEFTADQVLNVRFGRDTRRFEPEDLGMRSKKDGKPTVAWVMLRSMAETGGTLSWHQPDTKDIKKQKQNSLIPATEGLRNFGDADRLAPPEQHLRSTFRCARQSAEADAKREAVKFHRHQVSLLEEYFRHNVQRNPGI